MKDLIAKLEAATDGSRELDAEIWLATSPGAKRRKWSYIHAATSTKCEVDETRDFAGRFIIVPSYTTSLDAALTLVPEGWIWQVSNRAPNQHHGRAYLNNGELHFSGISAAPNPAFRGEEATAATPALALCIAALKARSA